MFLFLNRSYYIYVCNHLLICSISCAMEDGIHWPPQQPLVVVCFCPGTKLEVLETNNSTESPESLRPSEVILYFVYPGQKEMVTPVILSSVILATAMLQLYTELKAQSSMEALRSLQVGESVQLTRTDSGQRSLVTSFSWKQGAGYQLMSGFCTAAIWRWTILPSLARPFQTCAPPKPSQPPL